MRQWHLHGEADVEPVQLSHSFDERTEQGGEVEMVTQLAYLIVHLALRAQHGLESDVPI